MLLSFQLEIRWFFPKRDDAAWTKVMQDAPPRLHHQKSGSTRTYFIKDLYLLKDFERRHQSPPTESTVPGSRHFFGNVEGGVFSSSLILSFFEA